MPRRHRAQATIMAMESLTAKKQRALKIYVALDTLYPSRAPFLTFKTPFELLVAAILSAQCTDARVNQITPHLFKKYTQLNLWAAADYAVLAREIRSCTYFNSKAGYIITAAQMIKNQFNRQIPDRMEQLIRLPGVGRKTANVILGHIFHKPAITVDTHVMRLSKRMGFTTAKTPEKIEYDLAKLWPAKIQFHYASLFISHGRAICTARKPQCQNCVLANDCPQIAKR